MRRDGSRFRDNAAKEWRDAQSSTIACNENAGLPCSREHHASEERSWSDSVFLTLCSHYYKIIHLLIHFSLRDCEYSMSFQWRMTPATMNALVSMYENSTTVLIKATTSASFLSFPAFSPSAFAQSRQLTFLPVRESKTLTRASTHAAYRPWPSATYCHL